MEAKPPQNTRPFFAPPELRKSIFDTAIDAFKKKLNLIETQDYKLKIGRAHV